MTDEFSLIRQHFTDLTQTRVGVVAGIGDDAAVMSPTPGQQLVWATDTLIAGVHFPHETSAAAVGHKALAVNLSDLAAMGATPRWCLLALTLPEYQPEWVAAFATGLGQLAEAHQVALVGGDTTRGDQLTITVSVLGEVSAGQALSRHAAQVGDGIFLSAPVGRAALGLACIQGKVSLSESQRQLCLQALNYPQPSLALGQRLTSVASACIDVSDGLLADLEHLCQASSVAAELELSACVDPVLASLPQAQQWRYLSAGDDYQLLYTLPAERVAQWPQQLAAWQMSSVQVGWLTAGSGITSLWHGQLVSLDLHGYKHF